MNNQQERPYIYTLIYPDSIEFEVLLAAEICNKTFTVKVATPSGAGHRGSNGIKIEADLSLEELDLDKCRGILIPGGDPYDMIVGKSSNVLGPKLVQACECQIPIGAICAAPAILGKFGILKSRRFTHGYGDSHKEFLEPLWEGAEFTDRDVEVDGNLITAKPEAFIDFAVEFSSMVGAIKSEARKNELASYYRNAAKNR